jgi:hypothetical protein
VVRFNGSTAYSTGSAKINASSISLVASSKLILGQNTRVSITKITKVTRYSRRKQFIEDSIDVLP